MPIKIVQAKGFCYCMTSDFGMKFVAVIMILNSILSPWISIAYTVYSGFYLLIWPGLRLQEKIDHADTQEDYDEIYKEAMEFQETAQRNLIYIIIIASFQFILCIARMYSGLYFSFWFNDMEDIEKLRKLNCKQHFITVLQFISLIASFVFGVSQVPNLLQTLPLIYFSYFVWKYIKQREDIRASTLVNIKYDTLDLPDGTNNLITDSL